MVFLSQSPKVKFCLKSTVHVQSSLSPFQGNGTIHPIFTPYSNSNYKHETHYENLCHKLQEYKVSIKEGRNNKSEHSWAYWKTLQSQS